MFPNYLGIGAPRAGTTWLHNVLASHPAVYVPADRKEVQFFDRYYDRGLDWYEGFFPTEAGEYLAVGEVSPMYLSNPAAPARIAAIGTIDKLIVQLRNPVDRAYSEYLWRVNRGGYRGTIQEFFTEKPRLREASIYGPGLMRYLKHFHRSDMLVLVFEQVFKDPMVAVESLGQFLSVDPAGFDLATTGVAANPGGTARWPRLNRLAHRTGGLLRDRGWDRIANRARTTATGRALTSIEPTTPDPAPADLDYLWDMLRGDITIVSDLLGIDLSHWTKQT